MSTFDVLEPAIDVNNRISFLLDWELTMKCNLDCTYCGTGIYGGHDNSTKHPPLQECLKALDFMFAYTDLYMQTKPSGIKYVILNVYGGESLHHPDIVEILSQVKQKHQPYANRWHLTVTTTTNAIVSSKKLEQIIPYIDEFTVSYHAENTAKQKQQFQDNLLTIANAGRRQKCVIMMHSDPVLFQDCCEMIDWLETNNIRYLPKQLDHLLSQKQFNYQSQQVEWFDKFYSAKTNTVQTDLLKNKMTSQTLDLADTGRGCCGGRQMCKNNDYKSRVFFVENKFPDWYCSVNHFFLYVKQVNGEIYVNKDCKMNFDGQVAPIGHLSNCDQLLNTVREQIKNNSMPIIQCKKYNCFCGLCAPKAKNLDTYKSIMKKYQTN